MGQRREEGLLRHLIPPKPTIGHSQARVACPSFPADSYEPPKFDVICGLDYANQIPRRSRFLSTTQVSSFPLDGGVQAIASHRLCPTIKIRKFTIRRRQPATAIKRHPNRPHPDRSVSIIDTRSRGPATARLQNSLARSPGPEPPRLPAQPCHKRSHRFLWQCHWPADEDHKIDREILFSANRGPLRNREGSNTVN
jgi:hypothetical protein